MFNFLSIIILILSSLIGFLAFTSPRKHLLKTLISLEVLIIFIFMVLGFSWMSKTSESFNLLYFLVFTVSESALGLSLVILITRSRGVELFSMFNLMKW